MSGLEVYLLSLLLGLVIGFIYKHKLIMFTIFFVSFLVGVSVFNINWSSILDIAMSIYSNLTAETLVGHIIAFILGFYIGIRVPKGKEGKVVVVRKPLDNHEY